MAPLVDQPFIPVDPLLAQLADACGVATQYVDQSGHHQVVSAPTVHAVLAALGIDTSSPDAIAESLDEVRLRDWRRTLPPVFVGRQGEERRLWVHVPDGTEVRVWLELEDGSKRDLRQMDVWVAPVEVDGALVGEASFAVPGDLPLGYHAAVAHSDGMQWRTTVIMTPARLHPEALAGDRQWGFMSQLYATRSSGSWGLGDLGDAADLAAWSGRELGAGFLLLNPLHAASPRPPMAPSPYLPVTRRFANPIYIRVEAIPEFALLPEADRTAIEALAQPLRALNRVDALLDRDAVWAAKRAALEAIAAVPRTAERQRAFDAFCEREGVGLRDFATWSAMIDELGADGAQWPDDLRHPGDPAVARFRDEHRGAVTFHAWLQWILDEQLTSAQAAAVDAGMAIGLIHDLAVGVHPEGADAWALQDVLARGVSVGAPPDMYNQLGQDWAQPPWRPDALADAAFAPYRDMLRTVLRHAGGLRIDHVLGLFRLWWVPAGMPPSAGTYVRFDADAMLGVLCLEAHRSGALIIGEDLGTVPDDVVGMLADRGILGTSILWFERWADGSIRQPGDWRREVLASVTVHDLPPTAGYLRNEHVRIRADLGLLTHPVEQENAAADAERARWAQLLVERGWLDRDADLATDAGLDAMAVALHRAVAASPARLIGVGLSDVVGDRRAVNQPGTDQEYPNWRVPMRDANGRLVLLDDLEQHPDLLDGIVAAVGGQVSGPSTR